MFTNLINKNRAEILSVLGIVTIIFVFFLRLFYPEQSIFVTPDYGQSDLFQLNYPAKFSLHQALQGNSLPLWSRYIGTGFPLLAEGQIGTFNITNILLYKFLPFAYAINIGYILIFFTSAIGTYLYLKFLNFRSVTSFMGSILFAFSGFFITHISHINLIHSSSYLPWLFLLLHSYLYSRKPILLIFFALVLSQQFFSGFPQITFITLCGLLMLYIFTIRKEWSKFSTYSLPVISFIIFLGLVAVQLLPSKELLEISTRKDGFLVSKAAQYSFPFKHLLGFVNPNIFGTPIDGTYPFFARFNYSIYWENTGYIGILPLVFVIFALLKKKKSSSNVFYILLLFVALLLMTGKYSPLYFIYSFPPFNFFRVPSRFILLFTWSLVILSCYGFDWFYSQICGRIKKGMIVYTTICIVVAISLGQVLYFGYTYNPTGKSTEWLSEPEISKGLSKDQRYYVVGSGIHWNEHFAEHGWKNISVFRSLQNYLEPNLNTLYSKPSFGVYPILTTNRYSIMSDMIDKNIVLNHDDKTFTISNLGVKLLRMNGISTIISAYSNSSLKSVASTSISGHVLHVYEVTDYLPQAYLVNQFKLVHTAEEFEKMVAEKDFDSSNYVLLETEPKDFVTQSYVEDTPPSTIGEIKSSNGYLYLETNNSSDVLLVVGELYYPGWQAHIDGINTEIYAANVIQRAIVVPRGKHSITFSYAPTSFRVGSYISVFTHLFSATVIVFGIFAARRRMLSSTHRL